jgi:hypothetical protein
MGVEYDPSRVYQCAKAFQNFVKESRGNSFLQTNMAFFLGNILNLNPLNMADALYFYDEAFNGEVMDHLMMLIQYLLRVMWSILFKQMHHNKYRDILSVKLASSWYGQ